MTRAKHVEVWLVERRFGRKKLWAPVPGSSHHMLTGVRDFIRRLPSRHWEYRPAKYRRVED